MRRIVLLGLFVFAITMVSCTSSPDVYLFTSCSPNKTYHVDAYRTEPPATVDFSIKVFLIQEKTNKLIYNAYHESEVEITWQDDTHIIINGKALDLSAGETYDWRGKNGFFSFSTVVSDFSSESRR